MKSAKIMDLPVRYKSNTCTYVATYADPTYIHYIILTWATWYDLTTVF